MIHLPFIHSVDGKFPQIESTWCPSDVLANSADQIKLTSRDLYLMVIIIRKQYNIDHTDGTKIIIINILNTDLEKKTQ